MKTVAVLGTFDTKGKELKFIKECIEEQGLKTLCINTGVFEPVVEPDISSAEVAAAVGADINAIVEKRDRATATEVLAKGTEKLIPQLYAEGKFEASFPSADPAEPHWPLRQCGSFRWEFRK